MATPTKQDARQIISRDTLAQIFPNATDGELDDLVRSIDSDLEMPFRLDASSPADLTVSVGASSITNAISSRVRSAPHIGNTLPSFTSGTVVFPAASGGTITVTPGSNVVLTVAVSNYIKALIEVEEGGDLVVKLGSASTSESAATVPSRTEGNLAIGYVTLFNNAGTIDNIVQGKVIQFTLDMAETGTGITDADTGNAEISLDPASSEWYLQSPDTTIWEVTVDNNGLLTTTSGASGALPSIKVTRPDTTEVSFDITDAGLLQVTNPAAGGTVLDDAFYIESPDNTKWQVTVNDSDVIVMKSNTNHFSVDNGEGQVIFRAQEEISGGSSLYAQIYTAATLPSSPSTFSGTLPFAFYDTGAVKRLIFHDGSVWRYVHDNSAI